MIKERLNVIRQKKVRGTTTFLETKSALLNSRAERTKDEILLAKEGGPEDRGERSKNRLENAKPNFRFLFGVPE